MRRVKRQMHVQRVIVYTGSLGESKCRPRRAGRRLVKQLFGKGKRRLGLKQCRIYQIPCMYVKL